MTGEHQDANAFRTSLEQRFETPVESRGPLMIGFARMSRSTDCWQDSLP